MKKIKYEFSTFSKQIFLVLCVVLTFVRLMIVCEIKIFQIPGYHERMNYPATFIFYGIGFAILFFLLNGYKYFFSTYNSREITYHNKILSKEKSIQIEKVKKVNFGMKGIGFYVHPDSTSTDLFIPFFRNGRIDPIEVNNLYKMLQENPNIVVTKEYDILPGFGPKWKWLSRFYIIMSAILIANMIKPIALMIILYVNH